MGLVFTFINVLGDEGYILVRVFLSEQNDYKFIILQY